jgi:hypothetical protein
MKVNAQLMARGPNVEFSWAAEAGTPLVNALRNRFY